MQSKSDGGNRVVPNVNSVSSYMICSGPWWHGVGYNASSFVEAGENASKLSSLEHQNALEPHDAKSPLSNNTGLSGGNAKKEPQVMAPSQSAEDHGEENQELARISSAMPVSHDEGVMQPPQLELIGHSIAFASDVPHSPYYGGIIGAHGHQSLGFVPYGAMPHTRMPLPPEVAPEPVYVNAKQYQGILRRRQARAKAELEKKLIKSRKPYLHESRHLHAMRRPRGSGGRFAKKTNIEASNHESVENRNASVAAQSSYSPTSSGSERFPTDLTDTQNSSVGQQESEGNKPEHSSTHEDQNGLLQNSGYKRREEGDCSGQQWSRMSSNQPSQTRLAIK